MQQSNGVSRHLGSRFVLKLDVVARHRARLRVTAMSATMPAARRPSAALRSGTRSLGVPVTGNVGGVLHVGQVLGVPDPPEVGGDVVEEARGEVEGV